MNYIDERPRRYLNEDGNTFEYYYKYYISLRFYLSDPENLVLIICFNYIGKERLKYNMLLEKERQQQEASGTYILLSSNNPERF